MRGPLLRGSALEIAELLVRKYGRDGLTELLAALRAGKSKRAIAAQRGVTRMEVWRWQRALGVEVRTFQPHREVEALLRGGAPPSVV